MQKKFQVFVSSTYDDLHKERQEVMHALLELDCIPAGMELFPASNEDQWSLIKGVIDDCDYYIVISAGRYGSLGPEDVGYTDMEYRYAIETGKPVMAFLHKDPESLPKKFTEATAAGQERLQEFRGRLKERMCKFWETPQELGSVVSRSLIMLQRKHPGVGWVRGDLVPDKDASLEILALRKEIESLNSQLESARTSAPPGTDSLQQGGDKFDFNYSATVRDRHYNRRYINSSVETTWDNLFYTVSPLMIHEASEEQLRDSLKEYVLGLASDHITSKMDSGYQFEPPLTLDTDDFHTVTVQLRALGLTAQSERNRSVKDTNAYWTLTPYGDTVMNRLRALARDDAG